MLNRNIKTTCLKSLDFKSFAFEAQIAHHNQIIEPTTNQPHTNKRITMPSVLDIVQTQVVQNARDIESLQMQVALQEHVVVTANHIS